MNFSRWHESYSGEYRRSNGRHRPLRDGLTSHGYTYVQSNSPGQGVI